jgi:1-phosphofructokinase family hexose kinase
MLLSITPNPAVDRTLTVRGFRTSEVTRIAAIHEAAGGKGLNVVRAVQTLGERVRAVAPLGGAAGRRVAELAAAEHMDARWVWLEAGETRTCQIVLDPDAPDTLVLNEQGPRMSPDDWQTFAEAVRAEAHQARALASSGSLPPGVAVDWFIGLLTSVIEQGTPVWLDTSGAPLARALDLPLGLLKVNMHELGAALDTQLSSADEVIEAALAVLRRGPQAVVVTLGKDGVIAVNAHGAWHAQTPPVHAISPTGSGDAVLAGVAVALLENRPLMEAARLGAACGAANTLMIGGCVFNMDDVRALEQATRVDIIRTKA